MNNVFHSITLDSTFCNGCSACLKKCPTEAIRIRNGKAVIIDERCIDCGECIRECRFHAKNALADPLDALKEYKYKVALPAIAIYGQFPSHYDINRVFNSFYDLGFDYVYDVAYAADILTFEQMTALRSEKYPNPGISTYCPAVVRLIQMKYPSLIDHIIPLESPSEVAARIVRKRIMDELGFKDDEIGVFYISECPAVNTTIRNPRGTQKSSIDSYISMESIYTRIIKVYPETEVRNQIQKATGRGIGWAHVGGQGFGMCLENYLAVDGIDKVVKVLEKIELGKHSDIEFFEGYACVCGCVGGPLTVENPFIAKNKVSQISNRYLDRLVADRDGYTMEMLEFGGNIEPNDVLRLDDCIKTAIVKMTEIETIFSKLPKIDCGACGSPSCMAFAEDIVMERAKFDECVVIKAKIAEKQ
jgi:iron only hydrogenase large subunit-like protein